MEHTKTPWYVSASNDQVFANDRIVADCKWTNADFDERCANAAHIVHCVNAHDTLIDALRFIQCDAAMTIEEARQIATDALASCK